MTEDDKKLLTKYLYGANIIFDYDSWGYTGQGDLCPISTFTTRSDMMDLYGEIWKKGKWGLFRKHAMELWMCVPVNINETEEEEACFESDFERWLFCLSGEGYEERCHMVCDFIKEMK